MKKINLTIVPLFFALVTIVTSCKKLDENPDSIIVSTQFYKTQADAISAVN